MLFGDKSTFAIEILPDNSPNSGGHRWGFFSYWIGNMHVGGTSDFPDTYLGFADHLDAWLQRDAEYLADTLLELPGREALLEIYANVYWSTYARKLTAEESGAVLMTYVIAPNGLESFDNTFAVCISTSSQAVFLCVQGWAIDGLERGELCEADCVHVSITRRELNSVLLAASRWLKEDASG